MVYNERFYIAIVLAVVAVGIVVFLVYSLFRKPRLNDFDSVDAKNQSVSVGRPMKRKSMLLSRSVNDVQPSRRLMGE